LDYFHYNLKILFWQIKLLCYNKIRKPVIYQVLEQYFLAFKSLKTVVLSQEAEANLFKEI